jgi:glycine cleavage system regulatory protein
MSTVGQLLSRVEVPLNELTVRAYDDCYQIWGSVHGKWDALARLEVHLQRLSTKNGWTVHSWRPHRKDKPIGLPYVLEATFLEDDSKTMSSLLGLFGELNIFIDGIDYQLTPLDNQAHSISRVQFKLKLPLNVNVQFVREKFYGLCDDLNIDGSLELCQG